MIKFIFSLLLLTGYPGPATPTPTPPGSPYPPPPTMTATFATTAETPGTLTPGTLTPTPVYRGTLPTPTGTLSPTSLDILIKEPTAPAHNWIPLLLFVLYAFMGSGLGYLIFLGGEDAWFGWLCGSLWPITLVVSGLLGVAKWWQKRDRG